MRAPLLFRIAAGLLILFGLAHTVGFLSFRPPSAAGLAVRWGMEHVRFGANHSYGDFYRGFGLYIAAAMALAAGLAWWLGGLARTMPRVTVVPGMMLAGFQLCGLVLTLLYFGPPQMIFSAAVLLVLAAATWQAAQA